MLDDALPTRDETVPTLLEQVGAALKAANKEMASYRSPNLTTRPAFLGGCYPGWVAAQLLGGWVIVAVRPAGLMSDEDRYATQLGELQGYVETIFTEPIWQTMWERRALGFPALLVRKAAPDGR